MSLRKTMSNLLGVFETIENINVVSGATLNALLLFLIYRFTRKDLGTYKTFLSAFAGFDIFLCIMHWLIAPRVISYDSKFCVVATCYWESRHFARLYCSLFTFPLATLNVNFLYRYWSIKSPLRLRFFSKKYFKLVLFLYAFSVYSFWYFLTGWATSGDADEPSTIEARAFFSNKYNRTIMEGWLIMEYWTDDVMNIRPVLCLICVDSLLFISFSIASTLAVLTFYHIHRAKTLSIAARSFQNKVLIALCAQTFVPVVFVYLPFFCVNTFPFLGVPDSHLSEAAPTLMSCFPTWDAVVIILLMKDFREGLVTLIRWSKGVVAEATVLRSATTGTSVTASHVAIGVNY